MDLLRQESRIRILNRPLDLGSTLTLQGHEILTHLAKRSRDLVGIKRSSQTRIAAVSFLPARHQNNDKIVDHIQKSDLCKALFELSQAGPIANANC